MEQVNLGRCISEIVMIIPLHYELLLVHQVFQHFDDNASATLEADVCIGLRQFLHHAIESFDRFLLECSRQCLVVLFGCQVLVSKP